MESCWVLFRRILKELEIYREEVGINLYFFRFKECKDDGF